VIDLYYYENSVCSERVLMTLAEKAIENWTGHHIDLFKGEQANPEYLKLNPKAQVPTLVHNGHIIRESSIICDYLDDFRPQNLLKPNEAADIARMREWVKEADDAGFQAVAALSFIAVFRDKLLDMPLSEREKLWAEHTDLARTYRQKSCVTDGLNSPHAMIAISAWEKIFDQLEAVLSNGNTWIMGEQFTLAEINFAPLIARLEAINFLEIWIEQRSATGEWWQRLKSRPGFIQANVGPGAGEERQTFAREGKKIVGQARNLLHKVR
jgi:glutathione S-transferase